MPEEYTRGRSRGRLPSSEFDRAPSLQRSLSPRSESRFNTTPRRRSVERGAVRRNGHRSRSWSRSPSHNRALSRSRSRSRSEAPRRYRKKDFSRTPSPSADASRSSKIVIEKLTKNVTESHLREIFGGFGDIRSLDLPMNKAFMTNRGTAYILYHDPADAEAAIAHMHEAQLDGAMLNVSIVLPRRAFSRSPPPVQHSRASFGRPGHGRGPPSDSRAPRSPPPARKYRRSRHMERHDIYRPRSLSRSRSPRRSRSLSSKSRSTSPPPRRTHSRMDSSQRRRRRSPSYSSYGYSSRSDRERSASLRRDHH
ncbi:RNA-binding domain-containing protein [Aspergillus eucalypticola CBS 122712]|uniref:RNA-binding domain-containing protein n=1 Tax=Aspergillus eucalypticola (strain CBS 122712 / IBT 29274) TaxID=1448314 RepID=A0A317VUN8_ASPEC|nr:RNA-binding domain-containing protein [Aspergillus eucalypticola CBS 122712]PWY78003.1 RNA-binding domain-containing protein [Aspergillus eucalypticola CBS 122712]